MTRGTVPDPYAVIGRLQERNDLLRQELQIATQRPYRGFWRGVAVGALAIVALAIVALFAASAALSDPLSISGTIVTLEPADAPAVAVVTMQNVQENGPHDDGVYPLAMPGLAVEVRFTWNGDAAGSDRITVLPPDGMICEPRDCAATVLEDDSGTVLLLEWIGG